MIKDKKKILILNGPNLNLLGLRETSIYGNSTLDDLQGLIQKHFLSQLDIHFDFFQSNHEGELIDKIHHARDYAGIVINAGAYTHTSIALRDALAGVNIPFVEVHISNVYAREAFRHHSYLSSLAKAVICGAGFQGYIFAIQLLLS